MQKPDSLTSQYRTLVRPCEIGNKILQNSLSGSIPIGISFSRSSMLNRIQSVS